MGVKGEASVLVVEPDAAVRGRLVEALGRAVTVSTADTMAEAVELLGPGKFDVVLANDDLEAPGDGVTLLQKVAETDLATTRILVTSEEHIGSALHLACAHRFLFRPLNSEHVSSIVSDALRDLTIEDELQEHRERVVELEALALRDGLTGLYNHRYFHETLEREVARANRKDLPLAVVLIDVDEFKRINDSLGHPVGDGVIKLLGDILQGTDEVSRRSFRLRGQDVAARYGGDEFALILPDTPKSGAAFVAEQLRKHIDGYDFGHLGLDGLSLSIGVAGLPDDASDRPGLVKAADTALYAAKHLGRNRMVAYAPELESTQSSLTEDLEELEAILARGTIEFGYQPIVDVAAGKIRAYEALCRPNSSRFSGPADLIRTAERSGRMGEVGRLLRKCAATSIDQLPSEMLLFVNLHPFEVNDPELLDPSSLLRTPARIVFEISESLHVADHGRLEAVMSRLRELGAKIALDDLGSGPAGFGSLADIEPDFIKLSASLVRGIREDSRAARLLRHILQFATGEGIETIAEGVETQAEADVLRSLGCTLMQGWLFGKAEPAFSKVSF